MIPSRIQLQEKIEVYLGSRGIENFHFLNTKWLRAPSRAGENADIVMLGDGAYFFSHGRVCQFKGNAHFWVLCSAMRDLLVEGFQLPPSAVSIMDRYEAYAARRPSYSLAESKSFVYAGRDIAGKNIDELFALVSELQKTHFPHHQLHLFGKDFEKPHPHALKYEWKVPPKFWGDQGASWTERAIEKPVFINVSDYRYEDFSVASAEAQKNGMPIIISDWFGFRDLRGEGVLKLPPLNLFKTAAEAQKVWVEKINEGPEGTIRPLRPVQDGESPRKYLEPDELAQCLIKASGGLHREVNDFFGLTPPAFGLTGYLRIAKYLTIFSPFSEDLHRFVDSHFLFHCIINLTGSSSLWVKEKVDGVLIKTSGSSQEGLFVDGWISEVLKNITSIHRGRTLHESLSATHADMLMDKGRLEELKIFIEGLIALNILEIDPMSLKCLKGGKHD